MGRGGTRGLGLDPHDPRFVPGGMGGVPAAEVVLVIVGPRPIFFTLVAVVCLALSPFTPSEFRWVNWSMATLALFWSVMLGIEEIAGRRDARRRRTRGPDRGRAT